MTSKLSLGPIPKFASVRVTVTLPTSLKEELDRYAELHAKTWGTEVSAVALIPYILSTFIARDRVFHKNATSKGKLS